MEGGDFCGDRANKEGSIKILWPRLINHLTIAFTRTEKRRSFLALLFSADDA